MKKTVRLFVSVVAVILLSSLLCITAFADVFTLGGVEPYRYIRNLSDIAALAADVNSGNTYEGKLVVLMTALTLPADYTPVGTADHPFEGTFDGRAYKLTLSKSGDGQNAAENVGLFGVLGENAVVRNVSIYATVEGHRSVGAIAGENRGTVENCFVSVTVSGKGENPTAIGRIAGVNTGTVRSCFTNVMDASVSYCGTDDGTVENCYANGCDLNKAISTFNAEVDKRPELIKWYWSTTGCAQLTREHGGHEFINVDAIEPDCSFSGQTKGQVCKICGQLGGGLAVRASVGNHTVEHVDRVEPTCTEHGCTEGEKCSVCGTIISGCEPIEPTHGELVHVDEVPATATEDGVGEGMMCSVCGEKISGFEPITATGKIEVEDIEEIDDAENAVGAVDVEDSSKEPEEKICTECGDRIEMDSDEDGICNECEEKQNLQHEKEPVNKGENVGRNLYIIFIILLGCGLIAGSFVGFDRMFKKSEEAEQKEHKEEKK